jgi:hypothetical protein
MLQRIPDVPEGIDAFTVVGTLTADDYEHTIEPLLDEARRQDRRLRILLQIGAEYESFTAGAVWGKTETWRHNPDLLRRIDGYALVSDLRWIREWMHLVSLFVSFPLRVFGTDERDGAITWLRSLPEGPGVTHRLLPEPGVLVVEVTQPLRAQPWRRWPRTAPRLPWCGLRTSRAWKAPDHPPCGAAAVPAAGSRDRDLRHCRHRRPRATVIEWPRAATSPQNGGRWHWRC